MELYWDSLVYSKVLHLKEPLRELIPSKLLPLSHQISQSMLLRRFEGEQVGADEGVVEDVSEEETIR